MADIEGKASWDLSFTVSLEASYGMIEMAENHSICIKTDMLAQTTLPQCNGC